MIKELYDIIEDDLKQHYVEIVDYFYNDYDPLYYHRLGNIVTHTGGLYDALYIKNTREQFLLSLRDENLPMHRQDNSIVYDLNIKKGVHGGIQFIKNAFLPITKPSIEDEMRDFSANYQRTAIQKNVRILMQKYINRIMEAYKQEVNYG